jgi:hypothetical protein
MSTSFLIDGQDPSNSKHTSEQFVHDRSKNMAIMSANMFNCSKAFVENTPFLNRYGINETMAIDVVTNGCFQRLCKNETIALRYHAQILKIFSKILMCGDDYSEFSPVINRDRLEHGFDIFKYARHYFTNFSSFEINVAANSVNSLVRTD